METYKIWIQRAKNDYIIASEMPLEKVMFLEDLCFHAQQAAEKAIKGLLIFHGVSPEYTHKIEKLLVELGKFIEIPEHIEKSIKLTDYATLSRYPGNYDTIEYAEYEEALKLAKECLDWVEKCIV
jgi:HEPN domain-containing protein